MMSFKKPTREEIVDRLAKKYYLKITQDAIELSPRIKDSFIIRKEIVVKLKSAIDNE